MQIRELSLKELDIAYSIITKEYNDLSYNEFEDLIYEMQSENYKMIALLQMGEIKGFVGLKIKTNIRYKRYLEIDDYIVENPNEDEISRYLLDYAKMAACTHIYYIKTDTIIKV